MTVLLNGKMVVNVETEKYVGAENCSILKDYMKGENTHKIIHTLYET